MPAHASSPVQVVVLSARRRVRRALVNPEAGGLDFNRRPIEDRAMSEQQTRRKSLRLRWSRVAIAGAAALTLALASSCEAPKARGDRVFTDFSSPQLQATNDGTPLAVYDNGNNVSGLRVVDGQLTHGAPTTRNAAGYLEARITAPVTLIGAMAAFHSENSGDIALTSWSDSLVAAANRKPPGPIPNGGIHFVASNEEWHFGVWDSEAHTEQVLLNGPLALAADGTKYLFEVAREGDTVTVRLPDGATHTITDPRIGTWTGPWPCWELYEYDAERVPATFASVWAS